MRLTLSTSTCTHGRLQALASGRQQPVPRVPAYPGSTARTRICTRQPLHVCCFRIGPQQPDAASNISKKVNVTPGTLVFALDTTDASQKALRWTASSFATPGDDIRLVHVVCNPRGGATAVGTSSTGRVTFTAPDASTIDMDDFLEFEHRVQHAAQEFVDQNCIPVAQESKVPYEVVYRTLEGARSAALIGETICREAAESKAKALIIASHGPGMMAEFGSVARYCYQHSPCPLVILPPEALLGVVEGCVDEKGGPLVVAASNQKEMEAMLAWVAESIVKEGEEVLVLQTSDPKAPDLQLPIGFPVDIHLHRMDVTSMIPAVHASAHDLEDILGPYDASDSDNAAGVALVDAADELRARAVVVPSYSTQSMAAEMAHGSVGSYISRHSHKPLVLVKP